MQFNMALQHDRDVRDMIWEADENGDGFVEWDELVILYKRVRNDKDWIEAQVRATVISAPSRC